MGAEQLPPDPPEPPQHGVIAVPPDRMLTVLDIMSRGTMMLLADATAPGVVCADEIRERYGRALALLVGWDHFMNTPIQGLAVTAEGIVGGFTLRGRVSAVFLPWHAIWRVWGSGRNVLYGECVPPEVQAVVSGAAGPQDQRAIVPRTAGTRPRTPVHPAKRARRDSVPALELVPDPPNDIEPTPPRTGHLRLVPDPPDETV